ncbi:MAG: HTH domain-containing protein [bacterium]
MKNKFTKEQINNLSSNKNVLKCYDNIVTYSKDFKLWAVKEYAKGKLGSEIFTEAGFNLKDLGSRAPKDYLSKWNCKFRVEGPNAFETTNQRNTGKVRKNKNLNEKEKIKYLEAQVAYLKAENDFLVKLRAKRKAE